MLTISRGRALPAAAGSSQAGRAGAFRRPYRCAAAPREEREAHESPVVYRIRPDRQFAHRGCRDSRTGRRPGADPGEGGVAEFSRCTDRPGLVSGEAGAAVLAGRRVCRRDRCGRRRRDRVPARRFGGCVHRAWRVRGVLRGRRASGRRAAAGDVVRAGRGARARLRHVAARVAAARATPGGRDAARAGRGGRGRARGDRNREGARRARDRGGVERGQARVVP